MFNSINSAFILAILFVILVQGATVSSVEAAPEIISVHKIWDAAEHNAFTDLLRHNDMWFCTFRESDSHAAGIDGKIRIIVSTDGTHWESAALIEEPGTDLRDPKLCVTPDNRLMLVAGGSIYDEGIFLTRAPRVAFSEDGYNWTSPVRVLAEDHWLWRVTWHNGIAYSLSKMGDGHPLSRKGYLYTSTDGLDWTWHTEFVVSGVSETTLRFMPDEELIALIRPGFIGSSYPPYKDWNFYETGVQIGGPNFIRVPDGTLWAAARHYNPDGTQETGLAKMTKDSYERVLTLPSSGDTSYPGMVWYDGLLWISYYSSHEGKSDIYLAKIRIPLQTAADDY